MNFLHHFKFLKCKNFRVFQQIFSRKYLFARKYRRCAIHVIITFLEHIIFSNLVKIFFYIGKLMSLLYKNNLLNNSLYKLSKVPSPLCSFCAQEEETADHILFRCASVEEELRNRAYTNYRLANKLSEGEVEADSYIGLLNASRDKTFICSCIDILSGLNLKVTVDL